MFGGDADHRGRSSHDSASAVVGRNVLAGAVAIVGRAATTGSLAIRLLAAGILLVVGLPVLTLLLYIWGYPATPVPPLIVILVDGLQLLIAAYAVVVAVQLVVYADVVLTRFGRRTPRRPPAEWDERSLRGEVRTPAARPAGSWKGLREWSLRLANLIWLQELRGRPDFGPAALACVRDGVTLELAHRRHTKALERRAAELEAWIAQDSVVASERM